VTTRALTALDSGLDGPLRAVAAGKAAAGMARALAAALGSRLVEALVTAPEGPPGWRAIPATHPEPSAASETAGREALALADRTHQDSGRLIVGLSGGASAMLAVPAPGLTIEDKAATTAVLLRAGLDIGAVNLVRRHLSAIKGGQLALRAGRSLTLAISDVCTPIEDDPAAIGSGPTAGARGTYAEALVILAGRGLLDRVPAAVRRHLEAGAAGQVWGPVPASDAGLGDAAYHVIASRRVAMTAAEATARTLEYGTTVLEAPVAGEARLAPRALLAAADGPRPRCVIASGETVVFVRGRGRGGRNQELALAALEALAPLAPAALASIGTDGRDGPTDAAGAIVDAGMWARLGAGAALRRDRALAENDAHPLLDELGALVRTGPTGTNVGDLQVLLLG
jgi:glycerate-2-kinase